MPLGIRGGAYKHTYPFRIRGTAKIDGKDVVRYATMTDIVKTALGGMTNPSPDLLSDAAVAAVDKLAFEVRLTPTPSAVQKGAAGKLVVEVVRGAGADGDITLTPLQVPANVTPAVKPIPKGQTKGEIPLTVAAAAAEGPSLLVFRATTKVGGKDYTVTPHPVSFEVTGPIPAPREAKKDEPKKADPKKDEPKKIEAKKEESKKKEEAKKVEPKKDEVKKDEPKKVEPKKVEAKKVEAKKDEPKKKDGV